MRCGVRTQALRRSFSLVFRSETQLEGGSGNAGRIRNRHDNRNWAFWLGRRSLLRDANLAAISGRRGHRSLQQWNCDSDDPSAALVCHGTRSKSAPAVECAARFLFLTPVYSAAHSGMHIIWSGVGRQRFSSPRFCLVHDSDPAAFIERSFVYVYSLVVAGSSVAAARRT